MWGWDVWMRCCPPPPQRRHFSSSIFGRLGGGAWEQSGGPLLSPFSGHWPFKPAGCQGLSWSDPKGRVWSGTRGPFNCCCRLRAAHRLAWVVRGGDWPGPGERDRGLRQTKRQRPRQGDSWPGLHLLPPCFHHIKGLRPAYSQPGCSPNLIQLSLAPAHQHPNSLGPKEGS